MKKLLEKLGLSSILKFDNRFLGWIEPADKKSFWRNLISQEEIMNDLNFGVK